MDIWAKSGERLCSLGFAQRNRRRVGVKWMNTKRRCWLEERIPLGLG